METQSSWWCKKGHPEATVMGTTCPFCPMCGAPMNATHIVTQAEIRAAVERTFRRPPPSPLYRPVPPPDGDE